MSSLTTYLDGLDNFVAGWNMDGASGDEQDTSSTNSDLAITVGGGSRQAAAIEGGGTLSIDFDATTSIGTSTSSNPSNIWDAGGSLFACFVADGIGEGSLGAIWSKHTIDYLCVSSLSGSTCKLRFVKTWTSGFSISATWETTDYVITLGTKYAVAITYNSDSTSNDPVIHLYDIDSQTETTPALTESTAPAGTRTSDAFGLHYIGNRYTVARTWDGRLSVIRLYTDILSGAEISQAFAYAAGSTNVTINSVVAEAASDATTPTPTILVTSDVAASTGAANAPTVSTDTTRQIASEVATAATDATSPGTDLITSSEVATASSEAPVPVPTLSLEPPVIAITAGANVPTVVSIGPGAEQPIPGPEPDVVYVNTQKAVWAQFKDSDGAYFTPTTITFKARTPAGVDTSYVYGVASEVIQYAVGVYALTVTVTSAGKWTVAAKGENDDAVGQVQFDVRESVFD